LEKQFQFPPGTDLFITSEDNINGFQGILELRVVLFVPLVVLFGLFIRWLVLLVATGITECPPKVVAINCRMIGTWITWAFLLQEFVFWFALSGWTRVVLLALVGTIVISAPQVVVIAPREPLAHLFLLLAPIMHHVTKSCNSLWSVPPKVSINAWIGDAIVEAVDNVLLQDVRNGGSQVEEMACV
jgi:hypothetical protein